ncbi:MAG: hypothetical protein DME97_17725 [Verrucomicrobia bacterium]|nr:MAG: hypothetical protein DME97_17725 [Verrucomicrobiota bacterium]
MEFEGSRTELGRQRIEDGGSRMGVSGAKTGEAPTNEDVAGPRRRFACSRNARERAKVAI